MNTIVEESKWEPFFRSYTQHYAGRRTRLAVFEVNDGTMNDLWLENGLPLVEVALFSNKKEASIGIILENCTHMVAEPEVVSIVQNGPDTGLDILDTNGTTTVLRFDGSDS